MEITLTPEFYLFAILFLLISSSEHVIELEKMDFSLKNFCEGQCYH